MMKIEEGDQMNSKTFNHSINSDVKRFLMFKILDDIRVLMTVKL